MSRKFCRTFNNSQVNEVASDTPVSISQHLAAIRKLITPSELAEILSISQKTIYARVKAGTMPAVRIGSMIRFDPLTVANWLEARAA